MKEGSPGHATQSEREYRFLIPRVQAEALLAAVRPHLELVVHDVDRPVAYARTTYLDTDSLEYYRSCTHGPVARRLRVREYAAAADTSSEPVFTGIAFLEQKESAGAARIKQRAPIEAGAFERVLRGDPTPMPPDPAAALLYGEVVRRVRSDNLRPRLVTWYRRATLSDAAGAIRVTMDEGIAYCRPGLLGEGGAPVPPLDVAQYGPSRVVEVKLAIPPPPWIEAAVRGVAEDRGYSKFKAGMAALRRAARGGLGRKTMPLEILGATRAERSGGDR